MGLKDVLNLARTPEKREEMKKLLLKLLLEERRDEDIDLSDMPEVTDFSRFKPFKPRFDEMRAKNLRLKAEQERKRLNEGNA